MQNDDKIREILSGTKVKAGENLKYRVMQQIETEKALAPVKKKKVTSLSPVWSMLTIFGVMYVLIGMIALFIYLHAGTDALATPMFFLPVLLIGAVCTMFLGVTVYDERRKSKHRSNK